VSPSFADAGDQLDDNHLLCSITVEYTQSTFILCLHVIMLAGVQQCDMAVLGSGLGLELGLGVYWTATYAPFISYIHF